MSNEKVINIERLKERKEIETLVRGFAEWSEEHAKAYNAFYLEMVAKIPDMYHWAKMNGIETPAGMVPIRSEAEQMEGILEHVANYERSSKS